MTSVYEITVDVLSPFSTRYEKGHLKIVQKDDYEVWIHYLQNNILYVKTTNVEDAFKYLHGGMKLLMTGGLIYKNCWQCERPYYYPKISCDYCLIVMPNIAYRVQTKIENIPKHLGNFKHTKLSENEHYRGLQKSCTTDVILRDPPREEHTNSREIYL